MLGRNAGPFSLGAQLSSETVGFLGGPQTAPQQSLSALASQRRQSQGCSCCLYAAPVVGQ